ncbi:MAG: hypothetical protein D6693_03925 [Planctomycetota bacterium]|nr:MAG: hypothetical protein D6693_03925 [Planctomycetota bacterium]
MNARLWRRVVVGGVLFMVIGAGAWPIYRYYWVVSPIPEAFASALPYEAALEAARQADRPVVAVVTADFCPTCQAYKRNGLRDPRVADWVRGHATPVYLEWERDADTIQRLGVGGFPATVLIDPGGDVVQMAYGAMPGDRLLAWLEDGQTRAAHAHADAAAGPGAP